MLHPLPLPLSSCLGCIPPLIGLPSLRFYAVGSGLFLLSVCFWFMFSILSRRCPLLATSLSVLFCLLSLLISDSRFDLVWFRLSCDHGWVRSGSINVRKQQQQQQWPKTGVLENNSGREYCWPYLIGRHPHSPVLGQNRPGAPGYSYFAQLPPVFGHFMFLSGGLLDY